MFCVRMPDMRKERNLMNTAEGRSAFADMIKVFTKIDDEEDMKRLFDDMFTSAEVDDFLLRWLLMDDLYRGKSQRDIAKNRSISLCKITRGSKMLKKKEGFMRNLLSSRYDDHLHI